VVGSVRGLFRVASRVFSTVSGSGQVGSNCVGLRGSPWMIQNFTLDVVGLIIVKFTFYELPVLLMLRVQLHIVLTPKIKFN